MSDAPPVHDEARRLAALHGYAILDTPPEQGFDDLAHLTAQACAAPVALVSLVDRDRQWFKARVGFPYCETDLDRSVCKFVLAEPDLLVIPDLAADPRTSANPLVTDAPRIRFYAGAPLRSSEGHVLGSLCVIDTESRPDGLTPGQADSLRRFARLGVEQLELRRTLAARDALLGEQRRALREREVFRTTAAAIAGAGGDLDVIFATLIAGTLEAVPAAQAVAVEIVDGGELEYRAVGGTLAPHRGLRVPLRGSLSGACASGRAALLVPDAASDPRVNQAVARGMDLRSAVLAPIMRADRVIGVLKLQAASPDAFTSRDLDVARLFAGAVTAGLTEADAAAAGRAVRASEDRYRAIFQSATDFAIVATDRDGLVTDWNRGAENILGWSAAEMRGQTAERFFTPEDRATGRIAVEMRGALAEGRANDERWHLRRDGTRFFASGEMMPLRDAAGGHLGFLKVLRDRTAEHRTGVALREMEESLRRAQEAGGIGVFTVDVAADVIHPTPEFCRLYGLAVADSYPTAAVEALIVPEDQALVSTAAGRARGAVIRDVQYRIRRADTGDTRWIARTGEVKRDARGTAVGFAGVARDVTDERAARALLEATEAQARAFAAERGFIIELTAKQRAMPDPEEIMRSSAEALGRRLGAHRAGFYRLAGPDTLRYVPGWSDGTMRGLLGEMSADAFGRRVEGHRRSGRALAFSDSRHDPGGGLEPFAQGGVLAGICLSIHDRDRWRGGFYLHSAAVRAWTPDEVALATEVAELTWLAVERAEATIRLHHRIGQQDETIGQVAGELQAETAGRAAAEEQLRQLQKMEAVGQLTGGIAHDFNNMLAVIIGSLNLMERRLARGSTDLARYVEAAMDGASRAAALTHRLLAFARQQPLAPEPIDANRLVSGLADLLRRTLGERVRLETVLSAGLWKAKADPNQLENVVVNLATNARDAMPDGGSLTIETNNAHVDEDYARAYEMPVGHYVRLCVTDTGTGMTPDVLARAFDPFFTTKGPGKGTGLGLSQTFGFVRQSGGHVKVYSEVGHGTTFKIYLPRFTGDAAAAAPKRPDAPARGGDRGEIVMVVEDEERVRALAVEALRDLGYTVVHASSGPEALRMIEAGQDVTLLFTDIVLPEMTGRQLVDQVQQRLPQLKVVYTTGYTRNAVVHNGVIDPGTHFLPKPFGLDQLAAILRRVLDEDG